MKPSVFNIPLASLMQKRAAETQIKRLKGVKSCKAKAKLEAKGVIR